MNKISDFKTLCVHAGELKDTKYGGAISPLYASTSYVYNNIDIKQYPRYFNTPNQRGLVEKIAALEGADTGLIFGSGMAAVSTALFSHLKSGDHVIFQNDIYGGTRNFIKMEFPKYGIDFSFAKGIEVECFKAEITSQTKGIYIESPSNPLLKIVDLKAISELAKSESIWTMIDNTFASPVNQNPISHGIDIVIHSATKYLGGRSDISAGIVVSSEPIIKKVYGSAKNLGGNLSEYTVWLLERSIKTLYIRVQAQNNNAMLISNFLQEQDWVEKVFYPGLENHEGHNTAKKQMTGFGGMLSFNLVLGLDTKKFLMGFEMIKPTMSLAGVESTVLSPRLTSHALLSEEERQAQGINEQMVRFSAGIEAVEDIKNDILQSISKIS